MKVHKVEQAIRGLAEAYEKRDETRFTLHLDPSFPDTPLFKEQVGRDFKTFSEIKMRMRISRVEVTKDAILTGVYWEGEWKTKTGEEPLRQSGYALFSFSTDDPPRLLEGRGDVPWGMSSVGMLEHE